VFWGIKIIGPRPLGGGCAGCVPPPDPLVALNYFAAYLINGNLFRLEKRVVK